MVCIHKSLYACLCLCWCTVARTWLTCIIHKKRQRAALPAASLLKITDGIWGRGQQDEEIAEGARYRKESSRREPHRDTLEKSKRVSSWLNYEVAAVAAAVEGICPITDERCISPRRKKSHTIRQWKLEVGGRQINREMLWKELCVCVCVCVFTGLISNIFSLSHLLKWHSIKKQTNTSWFNIYLISHTFPKPVNRVSFPFWIQIY